MLDKGVTGLMAAMPEELEAVLALIDGPRQRVEHGKRVFHLGHIAGKSIVAAYSRCGKVAAAATATEMIVRFGAERIIFTGLAGGLDHDLHIGDVVVADELMQHDLDARPLFPRFEVPLMGASRFRCDAALVELVSVAASRFIEAGVAEAIGLETVQRVHMRGPKVRRGLIVSGDQFIGSDAQRSALLHAVPEALCVEMEGAAVAQVASDYGVPVAVVRVVSDAADDHAGARFPDSLSLIAGAYARNLVSRAFDA